MNANANAEANAMRMQMKCKCIAKASANVKCKRDREAFAMPQMLCKRKINPNANDMQTHIGFYWHAGFQIKAR